MCIALLDYELFVLIDAATKNAEHINTTIKAVESPPVFMHANTMVRIIVITPTDLIKAEVFITSIYLCETKKIP